MKIEFIVLGNPCGKQRPKFSRSGYFVHTYTPDMTVNYENLVKLEYCRQVGKSRFESDAQIVMQITAFFQIPKSVSQKKRTAMLRGEILPTKKPDYDNIAKIVTDALNGIAYDDDAQVVIGTVAKRYSENPRVEVIMREYDREIDGTFLD